MKKAALLLAALLASAPAYAQLGPDTRGGGGGSSLILHPGYISGGWYSANQSPFIATGSVQVASTVYCALQQVYVSVTIKSLGSYFTTGVSAGNGSYALYNASAGRPSTLIDYAGPIAAPTTANTAAEASLHNTTDTLAPGVYFLCETQDNAIGVMNSIYNGSGGEGYAWLGTAAPSSPSAPTPGLTCTAASTCGTGFAAWSESPAAFTWASFASPTWAMNPTTGMPLIEMQAN